MPDNIRVHSFAPIARADARVLVLGSMPGAASLAAGQYYAHPRNHFWPIMGEVYGAGLDLRYDMRCARLMAQGVAVWDVLRSCERPGSLDADIRAEIPNDFAAFYRDHKNIRLVIANGAAAEKLYRRHVRLLPAGAELVRVPSTSPAHAALSLENKCKQWRQALRTAV